MAFARHVLGCAVFFINPLCWGSALAGEVAILNTRFELHGQTWTVSTTLRHADTGWEHYADAWRVVSEEGQVLATRTLYHPHVEEQPFTRSLSNILIAKDIEVVYVEARDTRHGWSGERIRVDLKQSSGEGFTVKRP